MTEIDTNVIREIEKNQKVEVVVKRDSQSEGTELDLVQVFVNMKKKRRIYAWILIAAMLIGFAVPMFMSEIAEKKENVSALITFRYPNSATGRAPDGTPLNINYLTSSYILNGAIKKTKLSTNVPVSTIEGNISIERLLSEETRQELEVVEKVINEASNKDYSEVKTIDYKYEGKYIITLNNGFTTDPEGKNKVYLNGSELAALLNNILSTYNEYFYKTYLDMDLPDSNLDGISNTSLDYLERLDSIVDLLNSLTRYCNDEDREEYLNYRSKKDGMSLKDVKDCIRLIRDIDVDYLYAYVYYNSVSKDKQAMVTRYEYLLRNSQRDFNIINNNIENYKKLISEFKNESININLQEEGTGQVASRTTDYYNELILAQSDSYQEKADISEKIANLNDKIEGFKNTNGTVDTKYVEGELDKLTVICEKLYNLAEEHASEIINSEFYRNSYMSIIGAQYVGDSFFGAAIKKGVIGMVVGLVLVVVIWAADGLAEEFRRGSKNKKTVKEEEA